MNLPQLLQAQAILQAVVGLPEGRVLDGVNCMAEHHSFASNNEGPATIGEGIRRTASSFSNSYASNTVSVQNLIQG